MASPVRASCTGRMGLEGVVSKRLDAPCRSGPSKTWLKSKNPRSVKPCDVSAGNGQISVCAVLARTHFFDAIETVLQRSNGDHEIAAAYVQVIRIRAWTVPGGVKSINSASKGRDQPLDLLHGLCRQNAALSSNVNLMFHFSPSKE
jgi:hypothetical protein